MERVEKFLKDADVYYLATMEGDRSEEHTSELQSRI